MNEATGRAKGGIARMKGTTKPERRALAQKAAAARWAEDIEQATHGAEDRPLKIGEIEIPCYVLADERRVITQVGMVRALGMVRGGSSHKGGTRLAGFVDGEALRPFISEAIRAGTQKAIRFRTPFGILAFGFEATLLADICDAILAARAAGALHHQQYHIAERCELLVRGFARVGIIALIDEATGYQKDRARDALADILEQFIAKELRPYIKLFPSDFYENLFRLRGLEFPRDTGKKPQYFGHLTNDIVWARLAPGVLEELRTIVPKRASGRGRKFPFTRWLTEDIGHPKLREHLASVTTIMKLSDEYDDFENKLERIHPRYDRTMPLLLQDANGNPM
jgi:hypothetical protein